MSKPVIIRNVKPCELSAKDVALQFKQLLATGYRLEQKGLAQHRAPDYLLRTRPPKHLIELFGVQYFLSDIRRRQGFRFYVAYVVMPQTGAHRRRIYPRIFYKDSSLIWRSASHLINTQNDYWIGKGDMKPVVENGKIVHYSAEETTNLPYEIDSALDQISRRSLKVKVDNLAIEMVLRNAPEHRTRPYADFSEPRKKAMSDPNKAIFSNKQIAWFSRENDPKSLVFAKGYAPDLAHGLIDRSQSRSKLYGGDITKYRIASINREVQYMFIAGKQHVWIIPPQPLDDSLMSYGVRAIEADAAEELCIPGYEFHYLENKDEPSSLHTQIPSGFAGEPSEIDPDRANAAPWIGKLPIVKEFRTAIKKGTLGKLANDEFTLQHD